MTKMLASVRSPAEARIALAGGADIIDLKEPTSGVLGRLPDETIVAILCAFRGRRPTSATIVDVPLEPGPVVAAVERMATTGVDIVKLGFFAGDPASTLAALVPLVRGGLRLAGVFFADRAPDLDLVERCADAGFFGVMLDTGDKAAGPLTRHMSKVALARFIDRAHRRGLLAGLAGSLSAAEVPDLAGLGPDYLGFRSALASGGRDGPLDPAGMARVRAALDRASPQSSATATAGAQSAALTAISAGASINSSNPQ
jgi:(5-formylfuran-3-yl)methyl phosphate synthase